MSTSNGGIIIHTSDDNSAHDGAKTAANLHANPTRGYYSDTF